MNTEMIIDVMGRITDENLDMDHWGKSPIPAATCGTVMCLAGHTVVAAGHLLKWREDLATGYFMAEYTEDGLSIEQLAQDILGLTDAQANDLFWDEAETVDELWETVTDVTGVKRPVLAAA